VGSETRDTGKPKLVAWDPKPIAWGTETTVAEVRETGDVGSETVGVRNRNPWRCVFGLGSTAGATKVFETLNSDSNYAAWANALCHPLV